MSIKTKIKHLLGRYVFLSILILILVSTLFICISECRKPGVISLFPLENYDQSISTWIKTTDKDYEQSLIAPDIQQQRRLEFIRHYFGSENNAPSPWNPTWINLVFQQEPPEDIASVEKAIIPIFSNKNKSPQKIGYGLNFRPYKEEWLDNIVRNMHLEQFQHPIVYNALRRGITVENVQGRILPTNDVYFYSYKIPGEGYPFDNLQLSAIWAGTPVYIIGESSDGAWSLVLTPDIIGWIKSSTIATVDDTFITTWKTTATEKLAAILRNNLTITDISGNYRFLANVGAVFPAMSSSPTIIRILIPYADANRKALIGYADISTADATIMPLPMTPHNIAQLLPTMLGRPYGWGGLSFYNDCSAEMKAFYTPFGIWLPRHSSEQVKAGQMVDMSSLPKKERLAYLMKNGHKFTTIIYIGGHVIMYIGNYPNPNSHSHALMAMTYQEIWGLHSKSNDRIGVIGQSTLFPLLLSYPEDPKLHSLANGKFFQISYLDESLPPLSAQLTPYPIKVLAHPGYKPKR